MKRFIGIIIAIGMLFTGCGNSYPIIKTDSVINNQEDFNNIKETLENNKDAFYNSILFDEEKTFKWTYEEHEYSCLIFGYSEWTKDCYYWIKDLPGINDTGIDINIDNFDGLVLRKGEINYYDEFNNQHTLNDFCIISLIKDETKGVILCNFGLYVGDGNKFAIPAGVMCDEKEKITFLTDYTYLIEHNLIEKNKHYTIN